MFKGLKFKSASLLFSLLVFTGCESQGFLPQFIIHNFTYVEFDKKNLMEQVGKNVIIPEYNNFYTLSEKLDSSANNFINNPDTNSLNELQKNWKDTLGSWEKIIVFQFGPVKTLNLANKIFFSPAKSDAIEEVLAKDISTLNDNYLNTVGVTKKGLPVIEYLIFNSEKGNNFIIDNFKTAEKSAQRKAYLKLLTKDLKANALSINNEWSINKTNYLSKLVLEANAFNMLLNNMIATTEDIKDIKIGTPLGKKSGGELRLAEIESLPSNNSKENIINSLQSIKNVFNGTASNNATAIGLDDYLDYLEKQTLKNQINNQIDKTIKAVQDTNASLSTAITKEPQKVETVYNESKELLRLLKVDMANAVNETVNFNVSDGD